MALITGTTSRLLALWRTLTSAVSFAGTVSRIPAGLFSRLRSGALTFSGILSYHVSSTFLSVSSAVTFAGSFVRNLVTTRTTLTAALTFSGNLTAVFKQFYTRSTSGLVAFASKVRREVPLYGTLYRLLGLFRTKSGGLSFIGTAAANLGQQFPKTYSSAVAFAGSLLRTKLVSSIKRGTLTFAGTVRSVLSLGRTYTGGLTPSGIVKRTNAIVTKSYAGALSFAGQLLKAFFKTYSGALSFAGAVSLSLLGRYYTAIAVLTLAGEAIRSSILERSIAASVTFSSTLSAVLGGIVNYYWAAANGIIDFAGTVTATQGKLPTTLTGVLDIHGRITIIDVIIKRLTAASIGPAGVLTRKIVTARTALSGDLSFSAFRSKFYQILKTYTGAVTFSGAVAGVISSLRFYTATGALSFAGILTRLYELLRTYSGVLDLAGALTRAYELLRTYSSDLTFSGSAFGVLTERDWRSGYLDFASTLTRYLTGAPAARESSLAFAGVVSRELTTLNITVSGELGISGRSIEKIRETLWLGPPNP